MPTFEAYVDEALATPFEGWDFSFIEDRIVREGTPWSYAERVAELAADASVMVDLGTGGGEFLSRVSPRPPVLIATEGYMPNVPVAARLLRPLGIHVLAYEGSPDNADQDRSTPETLPFRDATLDVVIDQHEAFNARDVARVLTDGGTFLTQQVGGRDCIELCEALGDVTPQPAPFGIAEYADQFAGAGLEIVDAREAFSAKTFLDVGAVLYYVNAIPWAFVGFSLDRHREALRRIHEEGPLTCHEHRLLFEVRKP
jgi:SAM-dependent methyltransferase